MIKDLVIELFVKSTKDLKFHSQIIMTLIIIMLITITLSYYASVQNFNENEKQWEKYNSDPSDMKYSSLHWQYPICHNNPLYDMSLMFLNDHDRIVQRKSCIVIDHCYKAAIGQGPLAAVDCSEQADAIKSEIASIDLRE